MRPAPTCLRRLAVLVVVALWAAAAGATGPRVERVVSVGFTVSDLDRSIAFFRDVLDAVPEPPVEVAGESWERLTGAFPLRARIARVRLGAEVLELTQYLAPEGRPIPLDSRSNDHWFQHVAIVVTDMDAAYARLRAHGVRHASSGPQRLPDWNPAAGGIEAFYFKDPDGHVLEAIRFPPGKGEPRWQRLADGLVLGIDHTAIVVADTDRSLGFYRDALGLAVAGTSENWGPEQERLNAVFGARLRITTLRAPAGPAVELLEYLAPTDGRAIPQDARASDLVHWETRVAAALPAVGSAAPWVGVALRSPGVLAIDPPALGFDRALALRDPDGHAVQVVAP